jgi:hypothetical protein
MLIGLPDCGLIVPEKAGETKPNVGGRGTFSPGWSLKAKDTIKMLRNFCFTTTSCHPPRGWNQEPDGGNGNDGYSGEESMAHDRKRSAENEDAERMRQEETGQAPRGAWERAGGQAPELDRILTVLRGLRSTEAAARESFAESEPGEVAWREFCLRKNK